MPPPQPLPPHPVLTEYYADADTRQETVNHIFNASASHYDAVNRLMSFGSGRWYRKNVLRRNGLKPGMRVLDVGSGTGVIALLAQQQVGETGKVVAVDPSTGMLEVARAAGVKHTLSGYGHELPVPDSDFDLLTMGYALRHVADLTATFTEFLRVIKPGGKVLLLEITQPRGRLARWALRAYLGGVVPLTARLFRRSRDAEVLMRYFWDTIEHCVPPDAIANALNESGFTQVERRVMYGTLSEYSAVKPHPA